MALMFVACQTSPASTEDTLNLAIAAQLDKTAQIDIWQFSQGENADYLYEETLSEPEIVREIIDSLNQDIALTPKPRCLAKYRLVFVFQDGSTIEMNYQCTSDSPPMLTGDDDFWQGRAIVAPAAFVGLLDNR